MTTDTPNPDWVAWLARAEADASGEDDAAADHVMVPDRPDRGWRRLSELLPKIVAGAIGGALPLLLLGELLYFGRLFR